MAPSFPNEPSGYREARSKLLDAEAKLRTQIEEVAALRRALPAGGEVPTDYVFDEIGPDGRPRQVRLSELFDEGKDSLFLYSYMFGPEAKQPCALCTSMLTGLDGLAPQIRERVNFAVVARAPIARLAEYATRAGWRGLRLLSSHGNTYQKDYLSEDAQGQQWPMANVFVRRDGKVRHFWGSEMLFRQFADGDPRHVDLLWPLWHVFDLTPEGRGTDWYPSLP